MMMASVRRHVAGRLDFHAADAELDGERAADYRAVGRFKEGDRCGLGHLRQQAGAQQGRGKQ